MRLFTSLFLVAFCLAPAAVLAVGEGTFADTNRIDRSYVQRIELRWAANTTGYVSGVTSYIAGYLQRAVFKPTAVASTYKVRLTDADGVDLLGGAGAGRTSNAVSSVLGGTVIGDLGQPATNVIPSAICGPLTVDVTNCGASASGYIILYVGP